MKVGGGEGGYLGEQGDCTENVNLWSTTTVRVQKHVPHELSTLLLSHTPSVTLNGMIFADLLQSMDNS